MPQNYKRKDGAKPREKIDAEIMKTTVNKVLAGDQIHTVAKEFGLSKNTLRCYVRKVQHGQATEFSSCYNVKQVFSDEEENELANYLDAMARMNHGLNTKIISKLAYDLAVKNKKKYPESWDKDKAAGYFWRRGFMDRHPELSLKEPEATSLSRSTSFNRHTVGEFFYNLNFALKREQFGAESIWNADETGVTTVQKFPKVIAPKKLKQVGLVTSSERGHLVTVCNAVNALGNSIPPFFIFLFSPDFSPHENKSSIFVGAPTGSDAAAHISGWMTEENFLPYLNHFVKFSNCSKQKKVLLLLDNHESHI